MRVAGRWLVAASAVVAVMGSIAMVRRISQANAQSDAARALALAELQSAARQSALCSARNPVGAGLRAEYFARDRWHGPPLMTRTERLNDLVDVVDVPEGARSARWKGWIKAPMSGRYRFHAGLANARIVVARHELAGPDALVDASVELAAGRFYPILIEAGSIGPAIGHLELQWTAPHGARYAVPASLLHLPTESVGEGMGRPQ